MSMICIAKHLQKRSLLMAPNGRVCVRNVMGCKLRGGRIAKRISHFDTQATDGRRYTPIGMVACEHTLPGNQNLRSGPIEYGQVSVHVRYSIRGHDARKRGEEVMRCTCASQRGRNHGANFPL